MTGAARARWAGALIGCASAACCAVALAQANEKPSAGAKPSTGTLENTSASEPLLAARVSGLLQVDAVLLSQASIDELDPATRRPLNEQRFLLRRGRVRLDVARSVLRGSLVLDANTVREPEVRVLAAELGAGWPPAPRKPWIYGGLGLFLIPFGYETTEPAAERMMLEPSTWVRAVFPGRRDLGARVQGEWSFLRYQAAVMNGNPSSGAYALRDTNTAKDLAGRIGAAGELVYGARLQGGASLLFGRGFHPGRAESKDTLVWRDANEDGVVQTTELQAIAGSPAEPSEGFERYALGGDLALDVAIPVLGSLRIYGEVVWAKNADRGVLPADPIASGRDQRELGVMLGLRQYVTRHVELGVRYDRYQPDLDASDQQGAQLVPIDDSFWTLAFAVAWCTLPGARLTLQYDHNHNALGRNASGEPTTLGADVLTLRAQMEL